MGEPDLNPHTGSENGVPEAPKPKFKTNNVNLMFKAVASDGGSDSSSTDRDTSATGSGGSASSSATKPAAVVQNGVLTLGKKKESGSTVAADAELPNASQPGPEPTERETAGELTPHPSDRSEDAAPAHQKPDKAADPSPLGESGEGDTSRKHAVNYTQEELSNKGISVAGRFHSASNENWEDEEEDWAPPLDSMVEFKRRLSSSKTTSVRPKKAVSVPKHPTPLASTSTASVKPPLAGSRAHSESVPLAPAAPSQEEGPAWGHRGPPVAKSLSQTIKEAKEKGAPPVVSISRPSGFGKGGSRLAAAAASGGGDALSRFRINAMVRNVGHGAPPLNPRVFEAEQAPAKFEFAPDASSGFHNDFNRGGFGGGGFRGYEGGRGGYARDGFGADRFAPPPVDDLFLNAKPRRALNEPEDPAAAPARLVPRAIPDRLRRESKPMDWKKPMPPNVSSLEPSRSANTAANVPAAASPAAAAPAAANAAAADTLVSTATAEPHGATAATTHTDDHAASPANSHTADSPDAAANPETSSENVKSIKEQQKDEMSALLAQVKRRKEAELQAEKEKKEKLEKLREQYRRELEEKRKAQEEAKRAEEARISAKKNERKAELERRRVELEKRAARIAAERAEREKAEREKAERERAEREKAEREKAEREKAEREKAEREKAEREHAENEKAEREKANYEKTELNTTGNKELDHERKHSELEHAGGNDHKSNSNAESHTAKPSNIPSTSARPPQENSKFPKAPKSNPSRKMFDSKEEFIPSVPKEPHVGKKNACPAPVEGSASRKIHVKLPQSDNFSGAVDFSSVIAAETVEVNGTFGAGRPRGPVSSNPRFNNSKLFAKKGGARYKKPRGPFTKKPARNETAA